MWDAVHVALRDISILTTREPHFRGQVSDCTVTRPAIGGIV